MQDVFIDYFNNCKNGSSILYPKSWLYRVTLNKSIDYLRKQKMEIRTEPENVVQISHDEENLEDRKIVRQAISRLKPRERKLVVLYSEDLSYREISESTGIKFSSVGKMLSRALKKLKKELEAQQYEMY
jgi:RNA polymerase sigma-70 factor (ECF subfamily)